MADLTSQDRGRQWDHELAGLVGGQRVKGSGNGVAFKLDVGVRGLIVFEGKHTDAESFRVTPEILDQVRNAVSGPASTYVSAEAILAIRLGVAQRRFALVELDTLIEWLKAPPEILTSTKMEGLRAGARASRL